MCLLHTVLNKAFRFILVPTEFHVESGVILHIRYIKVHSIAFWAEFGLSFSIYSRKMKQLKPVYYCCALIVHDSLQHDVQEILGKGMCIQDATVLFLSFVCN